VANYVNFNLDSSRPIDRFLCLDSLKEVFGRGSRKEITPFGEGCLDGTFSGIELLPAFTQF
jgi:hypothetical protein